MIKDKISNSKIYENCHRKFAEAFKIIQNTPLDAPDGTTEFDGMKLIVQSYDTKPSENKRMETHEKFIDIQYVASGEEKFFFGDKSMFKISEVYDSDKDAQFYHSDTFEKSPHCQSAILTSGDFAIFFPEDAHKPGVDVIYSEHIKKFLMKIEL